MKVKESINNIPEIKDCVGAVDIVTAKAKQDADETEEKTKDFYDTRKFISSEPITGHDKKDYPKPVEDPKATLDESLFEDAEDEFDETSRNLDYKKDFLSQYNFDFALNSEEDRQQAIDDCNQVLNILNNISVEDIENSDEVNFDELEADDEMVEEGFGKAATAAITSENSLEEAAGIPVASATNKAPVVRNAGDTNNAAAAAASAIANDMKDDGRLNLSTTTGNKITDRQAGAANVNNLKGAEISMILTALMKGVQTKKIDANSLVANNGMLDLSKAAKLALDKKLIDPRLLNQQTVNASYEAEEANEPIYEAYATINYTAGAMFEQGLSEEIQEMRTKALFEDYKAVCHHYIERCNKLAEEIDDDYRVEGLEFVTQGIDLNESADVKALEDKYLGKNIKINQMINPDSPIDDSDYNGREGRVDIVDDWGQLHGTWGGLAVNPEVDDIEIIG